MIVASHGKLVAKIMPLVEDERALNAGPWTRDGLYDDALRRSL